MAKQSTMIQTRLNFAKNEFLDFQYVRAMSYQQYGGASVGEVAYVAQVIAERGGTRRDWVEVWTEQGRRVAKSAIEALGKGQRVTALGRFLRAYNYLRAAEFYFDRHGRQEFEALYAESVACFDQAIALFESSVEKIAIPYEHGVSLPGYFFKPGADPNPCATVIICGGGDGFGEEAYFFGGVPEALARGFNVLVFHGPGQRGVLHPHPELPFRPDYEVPIGAVIDYALSRPDVDGDRLGLYGLSFGGYLTPRAAAYDRRIKALIANTPITNAYELIASGVAELVPSLFRSLGQQLIGALPARIWNELTDKMRASDWVWEATIDNSMLWTFGVTKFSEFLEKEKQYALAGLEKDIQCPTLCLAAEGESSTGMEQTRLFYENLRGPKQLTLLSARDGADGHIGINNIAHTSGIAYDWMAEVFAALA
jgi:hypothetical protein